MTQAMKTMLRELLGYQQGNCRQSARAFSYVVSKADRSAAELLAQIGVVRIVEEKGRGVRAYRVGDKEQANV